MREDEAVVTGVVIKGGRLPVSRKMAGMGRKWRWKVATSLVAIVALAMVRSGLKMSALARGSYQGGQPH